MSLAQTGRRRTCSTPPPVPTRPRTCRPPFPDRAPRVRVPPAAARAGRRRRSPPTSSASPATSSPPRRPAPARRRSRSGSRRSCSPRGTVDRVTVVAPTDHLKRQWAEAAERVAHPPRTRPSRTRDGWLGRHWHGAARHLRAGRRCDAGAAQATHRVGASTLVILDEVHHGGDALVLGRRHAGGVRARDAPAVADRHAVPQRHRARSRSSATLPDEHGIRTSHHRLRLRLPPRARGRRRAARALHGLRRRDALAHHAGEEMERAARRGQHQGHHRAGLAHRAATRAATGSRPCCRRPTGGSPRCGDTSRTPAASSSRPTKTTARAYAQLLQALTGEPVDGRAVRREGGERPDRRLRRRRRPAGSSRCAWCRRASTCRGSAVGVYATNASTPLFFAQAIGRFVRARKRGESASVFLPNVPIADGARRAARARARPRARPRTDDERRGRPVDSTRTRSRRREPRRSRRPRR